MEIVVIQLHLTNLMCSPHFQQQETAERTPASIKHVLTFDSHQALLWDREVDLQPWIVGQNSLVFVFTGNQSDQVNEIITPIRLWSNTRLKEEFGHSNPTKRLHLD